MSDKQAETLDKLYLEWSQFTGARTGRELELFDLLETAETAIRTKHVVPDGWYGRFKYMKSQFDK